MRSYISYIISVLLVFLVYSNCNKDTTCFEEETPPISFLDYNEFPCNSPNAEGKSSISNDYLYGYTFIHDTLEIEFRFDNTCGSMYQDSTRIEDRTIYFALKDTASEHYRCICEHRSISLFDVENTDWIRLILDIKFYAQDEYTACLDTVLSLHQALQ